MKFRSIFEIPTTKYIHINFPHTSLTFIYFISGVTIVKVGGNSYGSKGELSYKSGSRHEISTTNTNTTNSTSTPTPAPPITNNNNNNTATQNTVNNTAVRNTTVNGRKSESRSTGRLPTHRSMTRLNNFDATHRPPSSGGLHKSMTKLTSSQQNMARSSSQMVAAPTARYRVFQKMFISKGQIISEYILFKFLP